MKNVYAKSKRYDISEPHHIYTVPSECLETTDLNLRETSVIEIKLMW